MWRTWPLGIKGVIQGTATATVRLEFSANFHLKVIPAWNSTQTLKACWRRRVLHLESVTPKPRAGGGLMPVKRCLIMDIAKPFRELHRISLNVFKRLGNQREKGHVLHIQAASEEVLHNGGKTGG